MKIFLETDSNRLLNKTVQEIAQSYKVEGDAISYIDASDDGFLVQLISEYLSSSIFEDKKLIVVRNFDFFSVKKAPEKKIDHASQKRDEAPELVVKRKS